MNVTLIKKVDGRINRTTGLKVTTGLRVTAYCRVSTDDEDQKNSYESQKAYYKEKITSNPEWRYIEIYADEAISGTLDYKRNDFMRMIQDALDDKFDMIMTKSISRFARNTVDTLKYVRMLKEHNVAVFFEEEGINTLEMSGELLLTILSSVAQQESENTSTHVKLGLKMKKERGELIGFGGCLGYTYNPEDNTLTINEQEAEIVRLIYEKYLEGFGAESISRQLTKLGIKTPKGKAVWCETTVRKILKNEKYKGDVLQGKTFTIDPISHKRLSNMGEEDKYYISNHHEAIIDEETFEKVQQIMKERNGGRSASRKVGNVGRKYPMSNRIRCGFCGSTFTRRSLYTTANPKPAWLCQTASKMGKEFCNKCKIMRADVLEKSFVDAYKILCNNNKLLVDNFLNNISRVMKSNSPKDNIKKLETQKEELKNKCNKLLDYMLDGTITKDIYTEKKDECLLKIKEVDTKIMEIQANMEDDDSIERGIKKLKKVFDTNAIMEEFDIDVFDTLVDYIIVGGYNESGRADPYMLRFIVKTRSNMFKKEKDVSKEHIVERNKLTQDYKNIVLLDFIDQQNFIAYDKDKDGNFKKKVIKKVRVRVECDMSNEN